MDATVPNAADQERSTAAILWPRVLGPSPNLKEVHLACWLLFFGLLVIPTCFGYWIQLKTRGRLPTVALGFTNFYGDGEIVNRYPPALLYDYAIQDTVFRQISPQAFGPSPYPPFVALFFSLFARLSFNAAYLFWTVISLAVYSTGVVALGRAIFPGERLKTSLLVCLSLAYYPFFYCTLLNGRLSAIGVLAVGLAILFEQQAKEYRSGLALSLLAYKPTLLFLIAPMLLLTRRFKTIAGFVAGSSVLVAVATAVEGLAIWPAYLRFSIWFGKITSAGGDLYLLGTRYVDCRSLVQTIFGEVSTVGYVLLAIVASAVLLWLAILLWKSDRSAHAERYLAWAATLSWTLVLNVYVPVYDSILITLSIALTIAALRQLHWNRSLAWFEIGAFALLCLSWISDRIVQLDKIQILGFVYPIIGIGQLIFLNRAIKSRSRHDGVEVASVHAQVQLF